MINGENALEPFESYPFILNDESFFDEGDLGDRAAPGEESKIVEEKPEEFQERKARDFGIILETRCRILRSICRRGI